MKTYKIVRMYAERPSRTIRTGLTLEEAQAHCADPETSYRTAKSPEGQRRTDMFRFWFDGYEEETAK